MKKCHDIKFKNDIKYCNIKFKNYMILSSKIICIFININYCNITFKNDMFFKSQHDNKFKNDIFFKISYNNI